MRINSCPIPYLCLSFSVISLDLPSSFLTFPPRVASIHPVVSSSSSILHLSLKCFSYLRSPLSSTHSHPPSTPFSVYRYLASVPLFFMPVFSWQRCITAEVAFNLGEVTLSCCSRLRVVELLWGGARYNCYFVKCTRTQPRSIRHACQTAPRGPPPIPEPSHVKEPSPSHRLPPSYPPPSLRKSEIAVHTQPSTTSQSY